MQKYQDVKTLEEFGIRCTCYALNNEVGSVADLLHLRHWQTANVRNVSFRNSLQWPIYVINSVHKTTLSCNTSLLPFPLSFPLPPPHPHKGSTAKVTPFIQTKVNTIAFPHSKAFRMGILYPHDSPNFYPHFQKSQYLEQVLKQKAQEEKKNCNIDHVKLLHLLWQI